MARYLHWRYILALTDSDDADLAIDLQRDKLMSMAEKYKKQLEEQYELAKVLKRQLELPEGNPEREAALAYLESLKPPRQEADTDDTRTEAETQSDVCTETAEED